ncbi:hypothetical protein AMTR_s00007p00265030 [Amborella trichopoda]|uniref:Uncharacterized protein n=2 Tax=Amborella trichopoda TaxID=13333 RepID=W1PCV9_AMBTC|nr:hypothetical protein AMTR_s00007p00265030 [Amborella trichopoda]
MVGLRKDVLLKPYAEDGIETEIMRIYNLSEPPRFLFTIKEESRKDLESEDGKSGAGRSRKGSRNKSLSEILASVETRFETPLSSPKFFTPPLAPMDHNLGGVSSPRCYPRGFNHNFFLSILSFSGSPMMNAFRSMGIQSLNFDVNDFT